jgi:hypothetical protein
MGQKCNFVHYNLFADALFYNPLHVPEVLIIGTRKSNEKLE